MMTTAVKEWQAPGPGMWEADESHQSAPFSTFMIELFKAHVNAGFEEGSARYGLLIDRFDMRFLDGWMFMRPRIVGAPEKPGPLPPKWMFTLLFRLHPALRKRTRAAKQAIAGQYWRRDAEWWLNEGRDAFRARLSKLQAVELSGLNDAQLRAHLADVNSAGAEGLRIHFRDALAHWIGVGDWLNRTVEWTGTPPEQALLALKGSSPSSVGAVEYLDRIAVAASASPAALQALTGSGDAAARMEALRASSPAVAEALDAYLAEHGWRIYTGFDIRDRATVEMPENILDSISARLAPQDAKPDDAYPAALRSKVPAAHLSEYDALFDTAKIVYGVRDDDAGPCAHWTLGLVRRVLLEAGARLAARGAVLEAEHVFDATPDEVDALLGGPGAKGSAEELSRRAQERVANGVHRPPSRLGEDEGPPPPDDWMPPAVARVMGALMVAMSVEYPAPEVEAATSTVLSGRPASRGVYEGRACVVRGTDDFSKLEPGDVLVAPFTTTSYAVVLPLLGAVVTDKGGVLSHAAIVAREYAIPAVVNTGNATAVIADGSRVRVDGDAGTVDVLHAAASPAGTERKVAAF